MTPAEQQTREQVRMEAELRRGPAAHGWEVDQRWTLDRIVTVVRRLFGVSYHGRFKILDLG